MWKEKIAMLEYYKNPEIKFIINKGNFNKLMTILDFQEENIITELWKEKVTNLKKTLLKYAIPKKDEDGEIAIIEIALFPKEASELIVLLISAFEALEIEEDYTQFLKRK